MLVSDLYIIRCTRIVISINKSQAFGKAEEHIFPLLDGQIVDGGPCRVLHNSTGEQCRQALLLRVEACKHRLQLCSILRHEVGLAFGQLTPAVTDVVDLLRCQLRHLCRVAGIEDVRSHEVRRVDLLRFGCRRETTHNRTQRLRLCVDGQKLSVGSPRHVGDAVLLVELQREVLSCVRHGDRIHLQADKAVGGGSVLRDILSDIAHGIFRKLSGRILRFLHLHREAQHRLRQVIVRTLHRLSMGLHGKSAKQQTARQKHSFIVHH